MRVTIAMMAVLLALSSVVQASPSALSYQGRIMNADGSPLQYASVSFLFEITNPSGSCVVYREQVNGINMTNSRGLFDVKIGASHTYPASGTFTLLDAFNNSKAFTCDGGAAFNPITTDGRLLRVSFWDGTAWRVISPDSVIRSVPYSAFSHSAAMLGEYDAASYVLKDEVNNGATCAAGNFLTWDSATQKFGCAADSGGGGGGGSGTVTGVTSANSYLSITNPTVAPVFTVNVGQVANTVAAGNDARFTDSRPPNGAATGDLSGNYPNPTVAQLQARPFAATAPTQGQVILWDTTTWKPQHLRMQDIRNAWGGTQMIPATACLASESMTWSVITDRFTCQAIAINGSAITAGTVGTARLGTGTADATTYLRGDGTWTAPSFTELDPKVGSNTTNYLSKWNGTALATSGIYENGGDVGIGTSGPWGPLDIMRSGSSATVFVRSFGGTAGVQGARANGTSGASTYVIADDKMAQYTAIDGKTATGAAGLNIFSSQIHTAANQGMYITLDTVADNASTSSERVRILANGNVGVGTVNPGAKLEVTGQVKITGGVPGLGKVLTSDAAGLATWETLAAGSGGDFKADGTVPMTAPVQLANGTAAAPSLTFASDPDTGMYRSGANEVAFATSGAISFKIIGTSNAYMSSGLLRMAGGSQSAPAIGFENDGNSGIFNPNPDVIAISTNATEKVRIDATGQVGIGTVSPDTKLHVAGQVKITGGTPGLGKVLTSDAAGLATWEATAFTELDPKVGANTTSYLSKWNGTALVASTVYESAGSVGIGTATPSVALDVVGTIKASGALNGSYFIDNGGCTILDSNKVGNNCGSSTFAIRASNTDVINLTSAGNVGIGTASPAATLEVSGAIISKAVTNAGTSIDFSTGNLQYTSVNCGAITMNNVKSGGTYSLAVQGNGGGTCAFTAYSGSGTTGPLTVKVGAISMVQTATKHAIFSFMVMGTTLYVTAIDGY